MKLLVFKNNSGAFAFLRLKKKWMYSIGILLLLIVVTNFFPLVPLFLGLEPIINIYEYSNKDGTFTFREYPEKGRDLEMMERNFERFIRNTGSSSSNNILYRTFKINYFKFWKWKEYLTHPRWQQYDYLDN